MSEASVAAFFDRNLQMSVTWMAGRVVWRVPDGRRVILNHAFAQAPDDVVRALVVWVDKSVRARRYLADDTGLAQSWINAHFAAKPKRLAKAGPTRGRHHDLAPLVADVVARHGLEGVPVGWGKVAPKRVPGKRATRAKVTLAYYKRVEKIVIVNRLLDDPRVPAYVIADTLVHELCHHAVPPEPTGRRKPDSHGPKFQACWRKSPDRHRVDAWFSANLTKLLYGEAGKDFAVGAVGAGAENPLSVD